VHLGRAAGSPGRGGLPHLPDDLGPWQRRLKVQYLNFASVLESCIPMAQIVKSKQAIRIAFSPSRF